jgi:hypothetical protein
MIGKTFTKTVAGLVLLASAGLVHAALPVKSAMTVYQANGGLWYSKAYDGAPLLFGLPLGGFSSAKPFTGDLNGDTVPDFGIYDSTTAKWYVRSGASPANLIWNLTFGPAGSIPMAYDLDDDGQDDLVSFNPQTGNWNARTVGGTVLLNNVNWGFTGCIPVPGDYDGDGTNDLAVFDTSASKWYIRSLNGNSILFGAQWGFSGCKVVPGDYNNNGTDDLAVYNPANGNWFIIEASGAPIAFNSNFGFNGGIPVPGDFNGDGKDDRAIYQSSTGNWYIEGVTFGQNWGGSTLTPVPADPKSTPPYLPIKGADGAGGGFLWKPFADNGGTVVLLPSFYSVSRLVVSRDPSGTDIIAGFTSGGAYKGRLAFRHPLTGNNFGNNIYCVAILTNGQRQPWFIPAGGSRVD